MGGLEYGVEYSVGGQIAVNARGYLWLCAGLPTLRTSRTGESPCLPAALASGDLRSNFGEVGRPAPSATDLRYIASHSYDHALHAPPKLPPTTRCKEVEDR
jgi:hypothetical protein